MQTLAEKRLWSRIRKKQIADCKFYRQYAIGRYILDFYCPEKKLGVELDGGQHLKQKIYDKNRTTYLKTQHIVIIRFWDNEVMTEIDEVLEIIKRSLG